jgi:O-antigen ligase
MYAGLGQNIERAVAAGSQFVSLDPVWWGPLPFETNRAFSTFGNPDLLGGYLIFPWAIALGLALTEKHRLWRTTYWVFTVLNVFVGITSYVRGAWIGAAVSLIAIVVAFLRARRGTTLRLEPVDKLFIGTAAATAAVIAVVTSTRPDAVRNVATRIVSIFQFGEGSALTRFQIWDAAWRAIAERPIFGWGADTFRLLFPMFKPAEYVAAAGYISVADNVHNYPLQLASGIGIPGALALYGLVAWALIASARECFTTGRGTERLLLAGFWAGALGYMVHLLFGLSVTGSTVFLWLSLGVLLSPIASTKEVASPRWRAPVLGVVAAVVIVASVLNVRFIVADNHYLKGRVLTSGMNSVLEIQRAIELNPYNDMYRLELGAAWQDLFNEVANAYAQQPEDATRVQLEQQMRDTFAKAEDAYLATIEFVPYEYDTYVFLANLYNEGIPYLGMEYADKAIEIARRGIEVEEFGPAIRLQLAFAYMAKGRFADAIDELEYAVELDPAYSQARLLLGRAYEQTGRYEDAKAQYEAVLAVFPDNAAAIQALESLEASLASAPATP